MNFNTRKEIKCSYCGKSRFLSIQEAEEIERQANAIADDDDLDDESREKAQQLADDAKQMADNMKDKESFDLESINIIKNILSLMRDTCNKTLKDIDFDKE